VTFQYLYDSKQIRAKIHSLFSSEHANRRRVIVVAYVGQDACDFISSPKGVEIYCWPLAGATNPNGIAALQAKGAKIHFASGLHSKVYWVKGVGGLITSANLSSNALARGIQREAGVFIPSMDERTIDKFVSQANASPVTEEALAKLWREHEQFWATHTPVRGTSASTGLLLRSYTEWFADVGFDKLPWKINYVDKDYYGLQKAAKDEAVKRKGSNNVFNFINGLKGEYEANDWVLYCEESKSGLRAVSFEWVRLDYYIAVGNDRRKNGCPYQGVQLHPLSPEQSPPFSLDKTFRDAFNLEYDFTTAKPGKKFLNALLTRCS